MSSSCAKTVSPEAARQNGGRACKRGIAVCLFSGGCETLPRERRHIRSGCRLTLALAWQTSSSRRARSKASRPVFSGYHRSVVSHKTTCRPCCKTRRPTLIARFCAGKSVSGESDAAEDIFFLSGKRQVSKPTMPIAEAYA